MAGVRCDALGGVSIPRIPAKKKPEKETSTSVTPVPAGTVPAPVTPVGSTPVATAPGGAPAPLKIPVLADKVGAATRLNEILKPVAPRDRGVRNAQDRLEVVERETARGSRLGQSEAERLNRFYVDKSFDRRDDWLRSPTGRFADTPAARITGAILDTAGLAGRRLELTRALQAGLGDPTLARGSYARAKAESEARKQAFMERLAAEKERNNASWEFWKQQNAERRAAKTKLAAKKDKDVEVDVNVDMKGGQTFGMFPTGDDGYHRRGGVGRDKLALIAKSFGY